MTRALWLAALAGTLCVTGTAAAAQDAGMRTTSPTASTSLKIKVLSNRADLLSGGDALVEIRPQGKVDLTPSCIDVGGTRRHRRVRARAGRPLRRVWSRGSTSARTC